MHTLLSLLLACSTPPPSPTGVNPAQGASGTAIVVSGAEFGPGTTATLGGQPLVEAVRIDEQTLRGAVPDGLPPGPSPLVLTDRQGRSATLPDAFTVEAPVAEVADPCGDDVKLFSQIPPTGEVIKIDLHRGAGDVDRRQIDVRDVTGIELQDQPKGDATCSSIWIRTKQGPRHLFDADATVPLQAQAQKIANGLNKPLDRVEPPAPATPATPPSGG